MLLTLPTYSPSNYKKSPLAHNLLKVDDKMSLDTVMTIGKEMIRLAEANNGCGLAANQLLIDGRPLNSPLMVVRSITKKYKHFKKKIVKREDRDELIAVWRILYKPRLINFSFNGTSSKEGCLSFPGVTRTVKRPDWVQFEAITSREGNFSTLRYLLNDARVWCHEYCHLMGKTILDDCDFKVSDADISVMSSSHKEGTYETKWNI